MDYQRMDVLKVLRPLKQSVEHVLLHRFDA